jgi:hypothetical protein
MISKIVQISASVHEKLDKIYGPENVSTLKATCIKFDDTSELCSNCCYYSSFKQEQATGKVCEVWTSVFGTELQKQLISYMDKGVKVGAKFMDIWHARTISIPAAIPQRTVIKHSPEVQGIAAHGVVSSLNVPGAKVHKVSKNTAPDTELGFTISIVEVTRGQ